MFRIHTFLVLAVLLFASAASAQKRVAIGYSPRGKLLPPGQLRPPSAPGLDTQPPSIYLTESTGLVTRGERMRGIKTVPQETQITVRGIVEDDKEVISLRINGHNIPLRGTASRKSFGVKLRRPAVGRVSTYKFEARDRSGNALQQTYRISRAAPSAPAELRVEPPSQKPPPAPSLQTLPQIWLFAIGISKYQDASLNLNYAATDALSFYQFFRSDTGARLAKTRARLLINEGATRAKVIQSLTQTVKIASEKDLVIIFLASHGLPDADTGEINFLMHDTVVNNLVATGLSQSDLTRIIDRSIAKKILFIIDACHSGELGAGPLLATRGITFSEVNRLLSRLAKASDGVAMLTASSSNESSYEGEKWSGGAFTYYLLAGLRGRADRNKDQIVTLREAFDYLYEKVPAATQGRQHPELKGQFSNELPLVEVNP